MPKLYRIRDWLVHYENNRTKDMKEMKWVPFTNSHDGDGYSELMELPNNKEAIFGAFVAIVQVASKCKPRGTLIRSSGIPHDAESLSRRTRMSIEVIEETLQVCTKTIKWIEIVEFSAGAEIPQEPAEIPQSACDALKYGRKEGRNGTEGKEGKEETGFQPAHPTASSVTVEKKKFIDYVFLTESEHKRLCSEFGITETTKAIQYLDEYLSNNQKKRKQYSDHNKVLRNWVFTAVKEKEQKESRSQGNGYSKPQDIRPCPSIDYDSDGSECRCYLRSGHAGEHKYRRVIADPQQIKDNSINQNAPRTGDFSKVCSILPKVLSEVQS